MTTRRSHLPFVPPRASAGERGSLLITAMLLTAAIAIAIVGYLNLSRTALKLSHRTYFANDASNLAEAGLEEAIYCFNLMAAGTAPATAWTGWTISTTNAMRTLLRITQYAEMDSQVRRALEQFGHDAKIATDCTLNGASDLTLTVPDSSGATTQVTYAWTSATQSLFRSPRCSPPAPEINSASRRSTHT